MKTNLDPPPSNVCSEPATSRRAFRRGFTLVELMMVVATVGILAVLAIVGAQKYLAYAKTAEARSLVGTMANAAIASYERQSTTFLARYADSKGGSSKSTGSSGSSASGSSASGSSASGSSASGSASGTSGSSASGSGAAATPPGNSGSSNGSQNNGKSGDGNSGNGSGNNGTGNNGNGQGMGNAGNSGNSGSSNSGSSNSGSSNSGSSNSGSSNSGSSNSGSSNSGSSNSGSSNSGSSNSGSSNSGSSASGSGNSHGIDTTLLAQTAPSPLCGSAQSVPASLQRGGKYQPAAQQGADFFSGDFQTGWKCLGVVVSDPIYYRYSYRQGSGYVVQQAGITPSAKGFEVSAQADLHGNGVVNTIALTGDVDPTTQTLRLATALYIVNEAD